MQLATGLMGIIAVLTGLWTGPFVHIHEINRSRLNYRLAMKHSHFSELFQQQDLSGTSMESGLHHRRGIAVTVVAGSGRKTHAMVAEFQSSNVIPEPSIVSGLGTELRMRAHDPPARRNSSPRSPPA